MKIKTCPFCGDKPRTKELDNHSVVVPGLYVNCINKQCGQHYSDWMTIAKWNRRNNER